MLAGPHRKTLFSGVVLLAALVLGSEACSDGASAPADQSTVATGGAGGAAADCLSGDLRACYPGPADTEGVGFCAAGKQQCRDDGVWGACFGHALPSDEQCDAVGDEDCDGIACSEPIWSLSTGGEDNSGVHDVAVDSAGNVIVVGVFQDDFTWGGPADRLTTNSGNALFLAKLAPDGSHIWSQSFALSGQSIALGLLAIAPDDSVVLSGLFQGQLSFATDSTLHSQGSTDAYLAKFGSDGNHLWTRSFSGDANLGCAASGVKNVTSVAVSPAGEIAVCGDFTGTWGGPSGAWQCQAPANKGAFVRTFDAGGSDLVQVTFDGGGDDSISSLAFDAKGNLFLTGHTEDGATVSSANGLSLAAGGRAYTVLLDSAKNVVWSLDLGGGSLANEHPLMVSAHAAPGGGYRLTGTVSTAYPVAGKDLPYGGGRDFFAMALTASGTVDWIRSFGTEDSEILKSAAIDGAGNLVLTGYYDGVFDFGGGALPLATNGADGFVAKLDERGSYRWQRTFEGLAWGYHLAIDADGFVVVAGILDGDADVGAGLIRQKGSGGFVARYQP